MKKATIYTVAEIAGVSISTVSRIINNKFKGRQEVRERVADAMRQISYQPNPEARRLMGKKVSSRMIGIMAPFFIHPFFVEVLKGAYRIIHGNNYNILLFDVDTRNMKKAILKRVIDEAFLDGLLMVNMHLNTEEYRNITKTMPLVLVAAEAEFADCVIVDNYKGIVLGMRYLHQLGHRFIAFINNEKDIFESQIRERAFREEADKLDIQYKIDYRPVDRRSGYLAAKSIIENYTEVTCLFYYSDLMAYGGLDYINEQQLQDRMSIIGFDGFEMTFHVNLTTIAQPMEKMGETGASLLNGLIEKRGDERKRIVLDPWLENGKTCRKVPNEQ